MKRVLALACILLGAPLCIAQTTAAQTSTPAQTPTLSTNSTLVVVPALVRNKAGNLVFTLKANDFTLTDDGVPQKLTLDRNAGSQPLALVVLIEAGAASESSGWHPKLHGVHTDPFATLPTMIEAMAGNVPHKIAVAGFDSGPELLLNFTANMEAAADAIHELDSEIDGDGGAAILDALGFALDLLRRQPPEYRRAILLLSETHDRGSHLKLEDALRAIGDTNTAIYSFRFSSSADDAPSDARRELPSKKAAPQNDDQLIRFEDPNPGPLHGCFSRDPNDPKVDLGKSVAAQVYDCLGQLLPPLAIAKAAALATADAMKQNIPETVARLTGGESFKLTSEKALERDLHSISNHIPNRYVLSFQPQSPHPGFHAIRLRVPGYANLDVSARDGYWTDPEDPPSPRP